MSISDEIVKELDLLDEKERQKVLDKTKNKYMKDVELLNNNCATKIIMR